MRRGDLKIYILKKHFFRKTWGKEEKENNEIGLHKKFLLNVVNCKSFSVAAKKAFVSQPTISTHIKQLEAELGVQLWLDQQKM